MTQRFYGLCFVLVLLTAFAGCVSQQEKAFNEITSKNHTAVIPGCQDGDWWDTRHQQVLERVSKDNVDLIFIGDSITHNWENVGAQFWEQYYTPRNAVNMGFSGDRTRHVLWRFDHGEIEGISPKVAVVLIGINNIWENTSQEIADGIQAVCLKLQTKLPKTKVLLLGVFPFQENPGEIRDKIIETNRIASQIADGEIIHYLDIGDKFLRDDKTMSAEIMTDFLHPNATGYKIWAEAMEPKLAELMGEKYAF